MTRAGRLIVLEGLDGVGKTTVSRALADALGARWTTTPDPAIRTVRERIDATWNPTERALFYAGSVLQAGREARADRAVGRDVVVDRYWASTVAYARASGADVDLETLEHHVPPADITVFLVATESVRRRRLDDRGRTLLDDAVLEQGRAIASAYDEVLARPVSGHPVLLDVTALPPSEAVRRLVESIASIPAGSCVERQLSLFRSTAPSA